ncbi:MAG: YdcF family protein [Bryobacterales bacterium]|nr:YdcF family protein [Bryobacterales bacterium]
MARVFRRSLLWAGAAALVAGVALHPVWLGWLGAYLVVAEAPARAEMAVVLAGDYRGNRVVKGAELVKQGFVPRVLVSGPDGFYGIHESDLAIPFAVRHGYPRDWFIPFLNKARSTEEEANAIARELERMGVRNILLVTSDYHTRRAARIFRSRAPGLRFRVIAAPDEDFQAQSWWRTRQGRKQAFYEWAKTVAGWLGI